MNSKLSMANAPSKKCPLHRWVYKAMLGRRTNQKSCSKCGKVLMHTHRSGFYGMGQNSEGDGSWPIERLEG
jgi:hypothetical protein